MISRSDYRPVWTAKQSAKLSATNATRPCDTHRQLVPNSLPTLARQVAAILARPSATTAHSAALCESGEEAELSHKGQVGLA
jgi:hypothetical protein